MSRQFAFELLLEEPEQKSYLLPDEYENDLLDNIRNNNIKKGFRFNCGNLDDHLRFKLKEWWLIVGNPNVGKTFMALYLMMLQAKNNGMKFILYSQENDVNDLKQSLIQFYLGVNLYGMSDKNYLEGLAFVQSHFKFLDPRRLFSYKDIIFQLEIALDDFPADGFFIDPYNCLKIDRQLYREIGGGHEYHYEVAAHFANFAHSTLALITCMHTVTGTQRGIEANGHTKVPMLSDVEGGTKFTSKADTGTVFHRQLFDSEIYNVTDIHVQKMKNKRTGGKPTPWARPISLRLNDNGCGFSLLDEIIINNEKSPF